MIPKDLGELRRDISDHMLLLTATPHKGDPQNFSLFLQLLDADVRSIREAMDRRRAPFYPARLDWHEVTKVAHYYLSVDAMTRPMQVREDTPPYGGDS